MSFQTCTETANRRYIAYGLVIDSTIDVLGAIPLAVDLAEPQPEADITIRIGALPSDWNAEQRLGPYSRCAEQVIFDMPSVGRYLCDRGLTITIEPANGATKRSLEEMLIATALPVLLWMRNELVLHAACLKPLGAKMAIALSGSSGSGKSTLLEQFYFKGVSVIGDDTIRLTSEQGIIAASGLPCVIQQRPLASSVRSDLQVLPAQRLERSSLGALFFLQRSSGPVQNPFVKLNGVDAIKAILEQRHRARVLGLLGKEAAVFKTIAGLFNQGKLPIFNWYRCDGDLSLSERETQFIENLCGSDVAGV